MRWEIVEAQVLDFATLCNLSSLLLLLHFLTLVHPFLLLFFLLERECVWGKWEESEWFWGSGVGKYLQLMLTCAPCSLIDNSSSPTQSAVSALLSDGVVVTNDQFWPPINIQNRRNKQTFNTYAFTINIVPLVLEETCLAVLHLNTSWKQSKRRDSKGVKQKCAKKINGKAHLHAKTRLGTTRGTT